MAERNICGLCDLPLLGTTGSPVTCSHYFHFGCLEKWSTNNLNDGKCQCPVATCRKIYMCMEVKTLIEGSSPLYFPVERNYRCRLCKDFVRSWATSLNSCDHYFCMRCFTRLKNGRHICPVDGKPFTVLYKSECIGAPIKLYTRL
ncbi:unnamed protein product [Hymenolepis diminuta]|uniref:RING-type domain-containing protein n=1 Tax=Hymenolepis diminuta TaxID=6216 RepID=A0A564Y4P1_HYMDI|nr:unnamed protein product [Hymenolepis diminuta]